MTLLLQLCVCDHSPECSEIVVQNSPFQDTSDRICSYKISWAYGDHVGFPWSHRPCPERSLLQMSRYPNIILGRTQEPLDRSRRTVMSFLKKIVADSMATWGVEVPWWSAEFLRHFGQKWRSHLFLRGVKSLDMFNKIRKPISHWTKSKYLLEQRKLW